MAKIVALIAAALLLTACGGSASREGGATPAPTEPPPATPAPTEPPPATPAVELACLAAAPLLGSISELAQPVEAMRAALQTDPEAITTAEARDTAGFLHSAAHTAAELAATFDAAEAAPELAAALFSLSEQLHTASDLLATGHTAQHGHSAAAALTRALEAIDTTTTAHRPTCNPSGQ